MGTCYQKLWVTIHGSYLPDDELVCISVFVFLCVMITMIIVLQNINGLYGPEHDMMIIKNTGSHLSRVTLQCLLQHEMAFAKVVEPGHLISCQ